MAEENEDSGEKELEASEQKLRRSREQGDVPQSRETNTLALIIGIMAATYLLKSSAGMGVFSDFSALLYHGDAFAHDIFESDGRATRGWLVGALLKFLPVLLVLVAAVLVALIVQRSVTFSMDKIKPKLKNLSPAENLKKKYGPRGITDFLKDTVKLIFSGIIAAVFLFQFTRDFYAFSAAQGGQFAEFTFRQVLNLILYFCIFQLVLAVIDLPLQRQLHANRLRMTREEMKKEMKQSEGDPHLKQQRREKGRQISRGEMLQNVKDATLVMVNPEHYAVALKWDPDGDTAPICVAKGVDHLAARIREVAIAHNVPIHRDPPATRSIYRLVEVDEEIHREHFAAVAAAIQFVERVRKQMGPGDA
ncbi:MAG: flagellar type III secretion system protein FlhB [Hyphomonadaceae bacterium]|nr:flagellar type III secretion system protein FlhB [Hyphomonadaceae bacterium]